MVNKIRNLALLAAAGTLLSGCLSDEPSVNVSADDCVTHYRTQQEIENIAVSAYNQLYGNESRGGVSPIEVIGINSAKSRSSEVAPVYAVNFADSSGYALIASSQFVEPVLAIVEEGTYDPENVIPPVADYIEAATAYSLRISTDPDIKLPITYQYWEETLDTTYYRVVEPRLDVWYGQNGFYAKYCSNNVTGCGPTALGMALAYVEYPSLNISFDGRQEQINLDWAKLKLHKYSKVNCNANWLGPDICYASSESHDIIAKMLRQLGTSSASTYDAQKGTSTKEQGVVAALTQLGIKHGNSGEYISAASHLGNDNILIVFGIGDQERYNHIFIIDGAKGISYTSTIRIYETNGVLSTLLSTETQEFNQRLAHVVWGYDNQGVGYYNEGFFDPRKRHKLDEEATDLISSEQFSVVPVRYVSVFK